MIKIPKDIHNSYMAQKFTDDELLKIYNWIDKPLTQASNKSNSDIIRFLVSIYLQAPKASLTKAFVYQMIVLNGIIDDGIHDKNFCNQVSKCDTLKYCMKEYETDDRQMICWNLKLCCLVPGINIFPPFESTKMDFVELDDGILKKKGD